MEGRSQTSPVFIYGTGADAVGHCMIQSFKSTRRCSSRLSSPQTISTLSLCCKFGYSRLRLNSLNEFCRSDVGCKTVANMIKGKQPEEIRKLYAYCQFKGFSTSSDSFVCARFNIVNDFTPEEEAQIKKEVSPYRQGSCCRALR